MQTRAVMFSDRQPGFKSYKPVPQIPNGQFLPVQMAELDTYGKTF